MESGRKVIVIGDGRYDSPGFTAYYCTYVIMVRFYLVEWKNTNVIW